MKRLKLLSLLLFFCVIVGFTAIKLNVSYGVQNELNLINIEALANGEGSGGGCYGVGSFVCDHGLYYGRYY